MVTLDVLRHVEVVSRTLAQTKPELEAALAAEQKLASQQAARPEWQQGIMVARDLLWRSPDVETFLSSLRAQAVPTMAGRSTPPQSELTEDPMETASQTPTPRSRPSSRRRTQRGLSSLVSSQAASRQQQEPPPDTQIE
jgi:hypothetical protein